jgi:hypothetical protein
MTNPKKMTRAEQRALAVENADRLLALARKAQAELDQRKAREERAS